MTIELFGGGGGSPSLANDSDVTLGSLSQGQVLGYNGSKWVNVGGKQRIGQTILQANNATASFPTIPQTYQTLELDIIAQSDQAGAQLSIRFNADTGAHYTYETLSNGSSSGAAASTSGRIGWMTGTQNTNYPSQRTIKISYYTLTTYYKTWESHGSVGPNVSSAGGYIEDDVGWWLSTAAITSITILTGAGVLLAGSAFTLYGLS